MTLLYISHQRFFDHSAGPGHPEQPARLTAVHKGLVEAGLGEALVTREPSPAPTEALARVHDRDLLTALDRIDQDGGGRIDPDTAMNEYSLQAARLAAGAGLLAIDELTNNRVDHALCAVRPPGHHATPRRSMGFCILNSIAVAAASLAAGGEQVAIIDIDAHHGNGTQDAFYENGNVLYGSIHQAPFYPGSGALLERGAGPGVGATVNIPVPAGTSGEEYRRAFDEVLAPAISGFDPSWILVSIGFDAHRADPLTNLGLTAGDYSDLVRRIVGLGRRTIWFLEGGYDLDALATASGAAFAALLGEPLESEPLSGHGSGGRAVDEAIAFFSRG